MFVYLSSIKAFLDVFFHDFFSAKNESSAENDYTFWASGNQVIVDSHYVYAIANVNGPPGKHPADAKREEVSDWKDLPDLRIFDSNDFKDIVDLVRNALIYVNLQRICVRKGIHTDKTKQAPKNNR